MDMLYTRAFDAQGNVFQVPVQSEQRNGHICYTVKKEDYAACFDIDLLPGLSEAAAGSAGFYAMPLRHNGAVSVFNGWTGEDLFMPSLYFFGFKTEKACGVMIMEGMKYEAVLVRKSDGKTHELFFRVQNGREQLNAYEDITLLYFPLPATASYSDMAAVYRRYKYDRGMLTLKQKSEAARYAASCMEIRVRMAWKPVPSPVMEQTPATEPPLHVAVTFDRLREIMTRMKEQGIQNAEFCLVGWNISGHDGRWPQALPVEEKLGGEEKLKELIAYGQHLGYKVVCHTNSSDAYSIAENFGQLNLVKTAEGEVSCNNNGWSGGRMYHVCPTSAEQIAAGVLKKVRALGFEGVHYIDVLSVVRPYFCHDKAHPVNRRQCVESWKRILQNAKKLFGGIASEGGFDTLSEELDFALYTGFNLFTTEPAPYVKRLIPLWQLVFHGSVTATPSSDMVNIGCLGQKMRLKFIEFGGRPAMYVYSRFVTESEKRGNWMGDHDLCCGNEEELAQMLAVLKSTDDFYAPLAHLQLESMEKHEVLSDTLVRLTFGSGERVYINYGSEPVCIDGFTVPAENYILA